MSVLKILSGNSKLGVIIGMGCFFAAGFLMSAPAGAREACGTAPNINFEKFPYAFLCPRDSSNPNDAVLEPLTINGGDGSSESAYRQIPAGRVLQFRTGFNAGPRTPRQSPNDTSPNSVYVWTTIDINDSTFGGAWESGRVVPPGATVTEANATGGLQCPVVSAYAGTGFSDPNRSPYADTPGDTSVTCLSQGRYVYWRLGNVPAERNARFIFNVKINDQIPANSEQKICIRTNISVRYDGETHAQALRHMAKKSVKECYRVTSTPAEVHVRSAAPDEEDDSVTSNTGTGKGLAGVPITESKICDGNPANQTLRYTNGAGDTSFAETVGGRYCLRAPLTWQAPGDPTIYQLRTPILNNSVDQNSWENQVAGVFCMDRFADVGFGPTNGFETDCEGRQAYDIEDDYFEFVYDPVSIPPNPIKSASPAGSALLPANNPACQLSRENAGCRIDYAVTIENNRDGTFFNAEIDDFIPLNLRQDAADVLIDRIVLSTNNSPFRPNGWSTGGFDINGSTCRTGVQDEIAFNFGYGGNSEYSEYSCAFYPAVGAAPAHVRVHFDEMPAYSTLTLYWHGYTKATQNIGVYPSSSGVYCAGVVNVPEDGGYNNPSVLRNCEDRINGLQGVSNYASSTVDGDNGATFSNVTYNPIPGDILDVTKSVSTEQGVDVDGDGVEEYDPSDSNYDNATYTIQVNPNENLGPVEYQVIDQHNGQLDNFDAAPLNSSNAVSCAPSATAPTECGSTVRWNFYSWPFSFVPGLYNFTVAFTDNSQPLGSYLGNTAKVCWPKYWEVGHRPQCIPSNTALVERAKVNEPYFGTLKGGLHAGGGINKGNNLCTTADHGDIRANADSYGQYVVSGKNILVGSKINMLQSASQQCRPNISKSVDDYYNRGPSFRLNLPAATSAIDSGTTIGGVPINNAAYPTGGPSKVVRSGGDLTITDLTISRRWTLHVQGDLYITGDITKPNPPAPYLISEQPSLGIVVDGNVYISKDVANIDALIYAGKRSALTDAVTGGTINTCSFGPGKTLGTSPGYTAAQCKEKNLKVNGMLMGKKIQFTRTRQNTGANTEAELIELIGQTYILPPPGFTNTFSPGRSTTVQDKSPRF